MAFQWDYISFGYAALLAVGGVMGFVKKGSVASLGAGVGFGALAAVGAYLASKDPNNYYLIAGVALAVGAVMGYRFINSRKFMPAGMTFMLSLGMLARFGNRALNSH